MTWVQNVNKRTRFTEMSSEPHARKFGAAGGFPPGVSISTPCVPCGVGSEAVTALFLLVSVPRRARFWHRHSAHGSGRGDCHWHFAPFCRRPQPPFVSLLSLCSPFLHILKITVLLLTPSHSRSRSTASLPLSPPPPRSGLDRPPLWSVRPQAASSPRSGDFRFCVSPF